MEEKTLKRIRKIKRDIKKTLKRKKTKIRYKCYIEKVIKRQCVGLPINECMYPKCKIIKSKTLKKYCRRRRISSNKTLKKYNK